MARKNGIKRLLMYLVVIIGSLFVGFLAYFFARNDETIALKVDQGEIIYLNAGNTEILPLSHLKPSRFTEITVTSSNEAVVRYQENTNRLYASSGGVATITITTSNKDFGPFKFDIFVGDGSIENPWYISTSKQFSKIGTGLQEISGENFLSSHAYELIGDIDLNNTYSEDAFWTPIDSFEGVLQGEGHNVLNLKVISENIDNVGLFGKLEASAIIENINFVNASITALNARNVGIVAGINKGFIGKVSLNGSITSSNQNAVVGGVVGVNEYDRARPLLNMVTAKVAFTTRGLTGGLVGHNKSGIVFNSSVIITDVNVYIPESDPAPFNQTYNVVETFGFGGAVGKNQAGVYGENDLRQTAIKNVFVKFVNINVLSQNNEYLSKIGTVAFVNINGSPSHPYYIANNYINIVVLVNESSNLTELGSGLNIIDKTNVVKHKDSTFIEIPNVEHIHFGDIWGLDKIGKVLTLDFEASYENHQISNPGKTIVEKQGVIDAIKKIYTTSNPISYNIDLDAFVEDIEEINGEKVLVIYGKDITDEAVSTTWGYDENGDLKTENNWTYWTPIHSNNNSYNGEIIVLGGRVIIKNLLVETGFELYDKTYYGLFSHISGKNTIIENLSVEKIKINADASKINQFAGGFAGGIADAYLENITVDGVEIINADAAGFMFGTVTGGTFKNLSVGTFEKLLELESQNDADGFSYFNPPNKIETKASYLQSVNLGGFAGIISSKVEDINVHYGIIKHQGSKEAALGGLVGTVLANVTVKDVRINFGVHIYNSVSGKGYFGGISGYISSKSIVEYSFSLANIEVILGVEDESHAGGIAGYLASEAIIRHSFAGDSLTASGEILAKYVGGLVSINHGSIYQSRASGTYKGHNVGGAVYHNYGKIENILITGTLKGMGTLSSMSVAGIAVWMPEGSLAKYIISTASISGTGETKLFAETRSTVNYTGFETFFQGLFNGKLFNGTHKSGSIESFIIVNYGSALRQKGSFGDWSFWVKVFETTEDELKLQGGTNPYAKMGFTDLNNFIWKFETGQNPRLLNIAENPFVLVEED